MGTCLFTLTLFHLFHILANTLHACLKPQQNICKKKKNYPKQKVVVRKSRICKTAPIKMKMTKLLMFLHGDRDLKTGAWNECILLVVIIQS